MSSPIQPPTPKATGFHKKRIVIAVGIVVAALAAVLFILSGDPPQIVDTRAQVPSKPAVPPATLLQDPPEPKPPPLAFTDLWSPPPSTPVPPPESPDPPRASAPRREANREASDLYALALKSPITPTSSLAARDRRPGSGPTPGSDRLFSALENLETQEERLSQLQRALPLSLPGLLTGPTSRRPSPAQSAPPAATPTFTPPSGSPRLEQGTVLEAQLVSEINSDLPGPILAVLTRDIFDSQSFSTLLLPRGSKLLGSYQANLALGQNRLFVAWDRLILPDGSSIELPALPGLDAQGRSGLRDKVNHHVARIFGNAALLSLISAGFELSQPVPDLNGLSRTSAAISGTSQQLETAAAELLRQRSNRQPTVRIRAGTRFFVFLQQDLLLPPASR